MTKALTNKELVQFGMLTCSMLLKAKNPMFSKDQCEKATIERFNKEGIKCHLKKVGE